MNNLVLVGGAGGIGRSLAKRAADDGWDVIVMDLKNSLERHPPEPGIQSKHINLTDEGNVIEAFSFKVEIIIAAFRNTRPNL